MNLPYDMVRIVIEKAGLSHDCMRYIRFERRPLTNLPQIEFPTFNMLQKNVPGRRFVLISNPVLFAMRVFDMTHERFLEPDRMVVFRKDTGIITRSEVYYNVEEQEFMSDVWDE